VLYLLSLLAIVLGISYAINNTFGTKIYMFKSFQESMMISAATLFGYMDGVSSLVTENDILFILIVGAILLGLATMFINVFIIMAKYAYKESFRVISKEKTSNKIGEGGQEEQQIKKQKKVYKFENNSDTMGSDDEFTTEEIINSDESENARKRFEFSSYENVLKKKLKLKKLKKKKIRENDGELFGYTPHWSIQFKEFFQNLRNNMNKKNFKKMIFKMKKYTVSFFTEKKDNDILEYDAIETEFDESKKMLFPNKEDSNINNMKNKGKGGLV
jgi:hypothetical protein